ncbi:MAG: hypothetical protein OWQ50_10855 [Acidianus infernus]|nr:hypothetical protein [Acidianus infernus]
MSKKTAIIIVIIVIVSVIVLSYIIESIYVAVLNQQALSAMYTMQFGKSVRK